MTETSIALRPAPTASAVATGPTFHLGSVHYHRQTDRLWPDADRATLNRTFKRLSRRSLLMAGVVDPIIVDAPVDPAYHALLAACGAGGKVLVPTANDNASLADDVAVDPALVERLAAWEGPIELYLPSPAEERLSAAVGRSLAATPWEVADLLNDKIFFHRILEDTGLATIPFFVGNVDSVATRVPRYEGPVIVRAAASVGGSRVLVGRTGDEKRAVQKELYRSPKGIMWLLQPLVETTLSPNAQLYVDDRQATLFSCSIQQFGADRVSHSGNLFDLPDVPLRNEIFRQAKILAAEAALLGWRGVLGIDFIVDTKGALHPIEFNARHNTSTHGAWFANRLLTGDPLTMAPTGLASVVRFPGRVATVREWMSLLGDDLLDPARLRGVLPYGIGGAGVTALIVGADETDRARLVERVGDLSR